MVGYHARCAAEVSQREASSRARRGMPRHPIPAVLLARLAVNRSVRGQGLGAFLLRDAMERSLAAVAQLGVRVLLVHALDEKARDFYLHHGTDLRGQLAWLLKFALTSPEGHRVMVGNVFKSSPL